MSKEGNIIKDNIVVVILSIVVATVAMTVGALRYLDGRYCNEKGVDCDPAISFHVVDDEVGGTSPLNLTVTCPPGQIAVGGGAQIINGGNTFLLIYNKPVVSIISDSVPAGQAVGWMASEVRIADESFSHSLRVYAICKKS